MKAANPLDRLLVLACSEAPDAPAEAAQLYACVNDAALFAAARENEVAPHLGHMLQEAGVANLPAHWGEEHERTHQRIAAYLEEAERVAAKLAEIGVQVVALKNAGITASLDYCRGCSPMGDVDLLVRRADYRRAHEILVAEGYTCASRNPTEAAEVEEGALSGGTEYERELPGHGTFWLELQWRPVSGRWIRPDQEPRGDDLMDRSVAIPGRSLRVLSPEDNLLQVALHTAKHTYVRAPGFRLHTDVERLVRHVPVDWENFLALVTALKVQTAVYFSLVLPAAFFGTPVPPQVLERLRPPRWKVRRMLTMLEGAGYLYPKRQKFSSLQYMLVNALLYDDAGGLRQAVVPNAAWMRQRYQFTSPALLPYYHARRLVDLVFRRVGI